MPFSTTRSHSLHALALAERRPRLALLVSDREWTARALEAALVDEGYATLRAATANQAVAVCAAADPDVVFVEHRFTDGAGQGTGSGGREPGGLTLCRRLREGGVVSDAAPVVVTTVDAVRRSEVLAALGAGAWELCAVPGDASALLARCAVWVRAKRHADRVAEAGLTDRETGLYNLRGLVRRAREVASAARRADVRAPVACAAFRVERAPTADRGARFIGDVLLATEAVGAAGPGTTSKLVRQVRDACAAVGRASDVFARVGSRDFAVLAPGTTAEGVSRLVQRLRQALSAGVVFLDDGAARTPATGYDARELPESLAVEGVTLRVAMAVDPAGGADDGAEVVMRAVGELDALP